MAQKLLLCIAIILAMPAVACARIFAMNQPIDHALSPEQTSVTLVVAGKLDQFDDDGAVFFKVDDIILGSSSYQGQTLKISCASFLWPSILVPLKTGTFCILIIRPSTEKQEETFSLYTVVPARARSYARCTDKIEARAVIVDELLAQLETEKVEARQRLLLLQIAPILTPNGVALVERFLTSNNPWIRRSALAAVVYATEKPVILKAAATDVQDFFVQTKNMESIDALEGTIWTNPKALLLEHYFFLDRSTWKFGTRWSESDAEKHLRILNGMLQQNVIEDWVSKRLLDE